ncbi:MAG: hypothetical protein V3S31_07795 [Dehalococcoidia bacterium]
MYGAGAFCIYHPQSEIVVAALSDVAAAASAALDRVEATVGMTAGRTINIYAHESWQQLAAMSWLPMYAAFGDTTGIWMPYTRVLHADPRALLHELAHTVTFRAFPGANNLLAEGVAEWTAHEISNWAFFDAAKADSCTQSLTELATMRPIPFECQGAAARIVEQLVTQHGGLGPYWDLVQAAYADPVVAPVTVYGLTWDEIDALYR